MLDGTEFFECQCGSPEHTLTFTLSLDDDQPEIYTSVFLGSYPCGWRRLKTAVKYMFGYKCRHGHWDCFSLRHEDARRMQAMLSRLIDKVCPDCGVYLAPEARHFSGCKSHPSEPEIVDK